MSIEALEHAGHGHAEGVFHQFEDIEQQNESYIVGMWTFLVTEVMFFGPLFFIYTLYRWQYQPEWYAVHKTLDWKLGGLNTTLLLASSYSMAMGVWYANKGEIKKRLQCLGFTFLCGAAFMVVKLAFEWPSKFAHQMYPGGNFSWPPHDGYPPEVLAGLQNVSPAAAEMFFSVYFGITGLHGIHVVVGMICIATLMVMTIKGSHHMKSYIPTEMVGLYWHFVDLVWIFLYPLFYLMPQ